MTPQYLPRIVFIPHEIVIVVQSVVYGEHIPIVGGSVTLTNKVPNLAIPYGFN